MSRGKRIGRTHLVIPDAQVKPDVNTDHLTDIGNYILDVKPDVIVCIGDFFDMPSLSSYDKGKRSFEGRRYKHDIKSGVSGMEKMLKPIKDYNKKAIEGHRQRYKPEMHFTLGNHEHRIERATQTDPALEGLMSYDDFQLKKFGWNVHGFLEVIDVDGICYTHYVSSPHSDRALGNAKAIANAMHRSTIVGHQQSLDYYYLPSRLKGGAAIQCIIAGAAYTHKEDYRGAQGQEHFRGIVRLSGVDGKGGFCPMFVDLDYLKARYSR